MPAHGSILSVGSGDVILEFQPRNGHDWRWVVIVGDVSRFKPISRGSAPGMQVSEISEARQSQLGDNALDYPPPRATYITPRCRLQ